MKSKHAYGSRENIEVAKQEGKIDTYDVLFLDNGEIGWINADGKTKISTTCTQEPIMVNGVAGLGVGDQETIPNGKNLDEIIKMLVQRQIPAEYTQPTVSLTNTNGNNIEFVEAGATITPELKASFVKNDSGNLTNFVITKNLTNLVALPQDEGTLKEDVESVIDYIGEPVAVTDGAITFTAIATYEEGAIKNDNLGNPSPDGHISAGSIISEYSIIGQRNLFYGTGIGNFDVTSENVRALNNRKLNPVDGDCFTINVDTGQQYVVIAYPDSLVELTGVHYVEGSDPHLAKNFIKTDVDVADARGGIEGQIPYKCYVLQFSTPIQAPITLHVTI